MSAMGKPISQQAAALRIIGATTSEPRSSACTGPTVVASSPVPSHALEITPVRTQRCNWMSCSRARSRPAYRAVWSSDERRATSATRSGACSIVSRKRRTSGGSAFQSTYSGGSNAGKRFKLLQLLLELGEQAAIVRRGEGVREVERGGVARVGIPLQRPAQRLVEVRRQIGPELAERQRLVAQARDHHLLGVAPLERQPAGEHLEADDAEGVDVGARVERSPADLLRAHELRGAEDDAGRGELRDRGIGTALLGEAEVHDDRAVAAAVV